MYKEEKKLSQVCGAACIEYVLRKENNYSIEVPNLWWIFDLAIFCYYNSEFEIGLRYYNSNLMAEYNGNPRSLPTEVVERIQWYKKNIGNIEEQKLDGKVLQQYVSFWDWLIINVDSKLLYQDEKMQGHNHYVIVKMLYENEVYLISPGKTAFSEMIIKVNELIDMTRKNGQWILLLRNKMR